jgi:hypothetical protein
LEELAIALSVNCSTHSLLQKIKPLKKIPETDAIFANVAEAKKQSAQNPKSLRISLDSKAKVKRGDLSREGSDRSLEPKKTLAHDYGAKKDVGRVWKTLGMEQF